MIRKGLLYVSSILLFFTASWAEENSWAQQAYPRPDFSQETIQNYYQQHQDFFYRRQQYRFSQILTKDADTTTQLQAEFNALIAAGQRPEQAIRSLTDSFSQNSSGLKQWGDLGWVSRGKFPPEFERQAFLMRQPGEWRVFSTSLGHHLVVLMDIREQKQFSFTKVKDYIRLKLVAEHEQDFSPDSMCFIAGGQFLAGFNAQEISQRYTIWDKFVKPFVVDQSNPGWAKYIQQTYHQARVAPFFIDRYEVSYRQYREFLKALNHRPLPEAIAQLIPGDDYPAAGVSWSDAVAFCQWKGKRLPTQDEWEFAARGSGRRQYPWGEALADSSQGNFADRNSAVPWKNTFYDDGYLGLAPVTSYPQGATPEGVFNLGGNVSEWTATVDLQRKTAIIKGGSFKSAFDDMLAADQRVSDLKTRNLTIGFRCACDQDDK